MHAPLSFGMGTFVTRTTLPTQLPYLLSVTKRPFKTAHRLNRSDILQDRVNKNIPRTLLVLNKQYIYFLKEINCKYVVKIKCSERLERKRSLRVMIHELNHEMKYCEVVSKTWYL